MSTWTILIVAALASSVILMTQHESPLFSITAVVVSGIEALLAFDVLHLAIRGLNLALILAAALLVAGVMTWTKSNGKIAVTCATVVTLVGIIQTAHQLL